jgi:hypothetical protein
MAKRIYIAVIEIEKPEGGFHKPWVFVDPIKNAVQAISGHTVKVSVETTPTDQPTRYRFIRRILGLG